MNRDRWILWTAWTLIIGAGAAGLSRISKIEKIDPEVAAQKKRLADEELRKTPQVLPEDKSLARLGEQWRRFDAEGKRFQLPYFEPKEVVTSKEGLPIDVNVQPWFATPEAAGSLDGVKLTWTLAKGPVELGPRERAKDVAPTGLRIWKLENKEWKEVAKLDVKATSWADVEAAASAAHQYRVTLDAPEKAKAAKDGPSREARTPSNRRVKLVGGDATIAIVRVETYNRKTKAWEGRESTAKPGDLLWPGGWKLTGLRFKGFVLVADVVGDDGRAAEFSTKD